MWASEGSLQESALSFRHVGVGITLRLSGLAVNTSPLPAISLAPDNSYIHMNKQDLFDFFIQKSLCYLNVGNCFAAL